MIQVDDIVVVKEDAPGYLLWYQGKRGLVVGNAVNVYEEPRLLVTFDAESKNLPFMEDELIKVGGP